MNILIKQSCFLNSKDFSGNPAYRKGNGKPGVYLWGFSLEKGDFQNPSNIKNFFPYYVGVHQKCLYSRTYEHICNLYGGSYSIFDITNANSSGTLIGNIHKAYQKASKAAGSIGGPILPDALYPDLLHFPEGVHLSMKYLTDYQIKVQVDWMVKHFCIMYFELDEYNKKNLKDLEKHIGNLVGYERLITKPYSKPSVEFEIYDSRGNIPLKTYDDLFKHCLGSMTSVKFGI